MKIDFSIPSGEELFLDGLVPPEPRQHIQLRNNPAFIQLAARIKARHHDTVDPILREQLVTIMRWMDDAATPPKDRGKEEEKPSDEEDDLGEP